MSNLYAGAGWVANSLKRKMSPLGEEVADLLGDLFLGIYHMNMNSLNKVDWSNSGWLDVTIGVSMSSYDDDLLTRLVFLSHERMLRVELSGCGPGYMRATFYKRNTRKGSLYERMPTIDDHIASLRAAYRGGAVVNEVIQMPAK